MIRVEAAALERFRKVAEKERTDALVVWQDGIPLLDWRRPGVAPRFEAMSVTKSIASLVLGQLVDAGTVGLSDRLARTFPEWEGDPRGDITLRHVLEHTTGLADEPTTRAIYAEKDFVRFALQAKLERPPGTRFSYSNKASNLIAGVVKHAAGVELNAFAKAGLFAKLGIEDVEWWEDPSGHTQVMSGLQILPEDLAKLGQLVLDEGRWRGERLLSRTWIESSTRTLRNQDIGGPPHGLLWWLRPEAVRSGFDAALFEDWERTGMPAAFIDKFRPLEGRFFERDAFYREVYRVLEGKRVDHVADSDLREWYAHTTKAGRRDGATRKSGVSTIRADGWLGQYLFVLPAERVVVVRMRHAPPDGAENDSGTFPSIEAEIDRLVARPVTKRGLIGVASQLIQSEARARWRRFRER
jgi:CubicO group peptidase (beta-lactamase class C family)